MENNREPPSSQPEGVTSGVAQVGIEGRTSANSVACQDDLKDPGPEHPRLTPEAIPVAMSASVIVPRDHSTQTKYSAVGFDKKQLEDGGVRWISTPVLAKSGLTIVEVDSRCNLQAVQDLLVSHVAGGVKLAGIESGSQGPQCCVLLEYMRKVQMVDLCARVDLGKGSPPPTVHQLATATHRSLRPDEGGTQVHLTALVTKAKADGRPVCVLHVAADARQLPAAERLDEMFVSYAALARVGPAVLLYISRDRRDSWTTPRGAADAVLAARPYQKAGADCAFVLHIVECRFRAHEVWTPQVVWFERSPNGGGRWKCEPYISDEEGVREMYALQQGGLSMREIGARLNVDASTVSRKLKAVNKDLMG